MCQGSIERCSLLRPPMAAIDDGPRAGLECWRDDCEAYHLGGTTMTDRLVQRVLTALQQSPVPWETFAHSAPETPGVYAAWLAGDGALQSTVLREWRSDGPLYVGESANLSQREARTHFASDGSGWSTLRRSIGAILRRQLNLQAHPRGSGGSRQALLCYRFQPEGEQRLTAWMRENLRLSWWADDQRGLSRRQREDLETELIRLLEPPLSINKWKNPYRRSVKEERAVCTLEAESQ